jgi:hypothetical protein
VVADPVLLVEQLAVNAWPAATVVQMDDGWLPRHTRELAARGYRHQAPTLVSTAPIHRLLPDRPSAPAQAASVAATAGPQGIRRRAALKAGTSEEWIIVAVGDVGMGIRESLRDRYGAMTEDEAIRRAIEWYVSRVPDQGRGQGLPGVVEGVKHLGGTVCIRSGAASLTITGRQEKSLDVSRRQGTIVGARVPCRPGG